MDYNINKEKEEAEEMELIKQQNFRREAIDDDDSFIEEAPEELEGGTKMTQAYDRQYMKMTGLKSFR